MVMIGDQVSAAVIRTDGVELHNTGTRAPFVDIHPVFEISGNRVVLHQGAL